MRCAIEKRTSSFALDELERRRLFAVSASFAGGILKIVGDREDNRIDVRVTPTGTVTFFDGPVGGTVAGGTPTVSNTTQIVIAGGDGNDQVRIDGSVRFIQNSIDGGSGNDVIFGGEPKNHLIGGAGDDVLIGGEADDQLEGGAGLDVLIGNTGGDRLDGGAGDDLLIGGWGDDWISGGTGRDSAIGGAGNDVLLGGAGDDYLDGGDGDDTISGGLGRDVLIGGAGNNVLEDDGREVGTVTTGAALHFTGLE